MVGISFIGEFDIKVIYYKGECNQSVDMTPQTWFVYHFILSMGCKALLRSLLPKNASLRQAVNAVLELNADKTILFVVA